MDADDVRLKNLKPRPHRKLTETELKTLRVLCQLQCTYEDICTALDMDKHTFIDMRRRNPQIERVMKMGYNDGRLSLRRAMFKNAVQEGDHTMQIFLAKNILGFRDVTDTRTTVEGEIKLSVADQEKRAAELMFNLQGRLLAAAERGEDPPLDIIDITDFSDVPSDESPT